MGKITDLKGKGTGIKESFVRVVGEFYCTLRVLYGKYSSIISNDLIHVMSVLLHFPPPQILGGLLPVRNTTPVVE